MTTTFQVLAMAGEGIGREVTAEGVRVLQALRSLYGLDLEVRELEVGEGAYARTGRYLPEDAERACDDAQTSRRAAILFGAVADEPIGILRQQYDLFANLRPIRMPEALLHGSRLKSEYVRGVDMLIVRELVGDLYYGETKTGTGAHGRWASQEMYYDAHQIRRIVKVALVQASRRRGRLTYVHKGNVIKDVFALWRSVLDEERAAFPAVVIEDVLVDNMAMQMVLRPRDFDVVLCSNMFGDILSDLGAGLIGSIGLVPSASLNDVGFGLYEPIGGTAPDIAGRNIANPVATILSVAMMCRISMGHETAARLIERAVDTVLLTHRTADIAHGDAVEIVSTTDLGRRIVNAMEALHGRD